MRVRSDFVLIQHFVKSFHGYRALLTKLMIFIALVFQVVANILRLMQRLLKFRKNCEKVAYQKQEEEAQIRYSKIKSTLYEKLKSLDHLMIYILVSIKSNNLLGFCISRRAAQKGGRQPWTKAIKVRMHLIAFKTR